LYIAFVNTVTNTALMSTCKSKYLSRGNSSRWASWSLQAGD